MADQLISTVAFVGIPAGGTAALPHGIISNGVAYIPDTVGVDNGAFTVTGCTATTITVLNGGAAVGNCNLRCTLDYSAARALGDDTSPGNYSGGLTPRPFIYAAGSGSGGGSSVLAFTYTATGAEGDTFVVTLPTAMATTDYAVTATMGQAARFLAFAIPDGVGDRDLTDFVCETSLAPLAGDTIDFIVTARS